MTIINLIPKIKIETTLDLSNLSKINENYADNKKINNIRLTLGGKETSMKEVFKISYIRRKVSQKVIILKGSNKNFNNLGTNWEKNNLMVYGDTGSFLGCNMIGGSISVKGSSKNFVGCQMRGGEINIEKNAGNYVGSANFGERVGMNGGFIKIKGNAGNYVAQYLRRGTIVINGNVGNNTCNNMIAGSIFINGDYGKNFCQGMKRGTVLVNKFKEKNSKNFIYCGIQTLNIYSILEKTYLKVRTNSNKFRKFIGDRDNDGIGEILEKNF